MDRKVFFALVTFAFSLFALWLVYTIVGPFLRPLGWAAVLGLLTFPLYRQLRKWLGERETLAAALMTPAVVLTLILPVVGLMALLTQEVIAFSQLLRQASAAGPLLDLSHFQDWPWIKPLLSIIQPLIDRLNLDIPAMVAPAAEKLTSVALDYSRAMVANFFTFVIKLLLMVVALFFIYRDGEGFVRGFWSVVPLDDSSRQVLASTVKRVLTAVIYGIFLTCLVQGFLGGLGFWFTGLPSPILFGAAMVLLAPVPIVGTALIWGPGAVYLFSQGETVLAGVLIAWGVLVVGSIDNILRPLFISGRGKVPILLVAIGVLGGLVSFGLIGVITGPLVLALFLALFDIYKARFFPAESGGVMEDSGD